MFNAKWHQIWLMKKYLSYIRPIKLLKISFSWLVGREMHISIYLYSCLLIHYFCNPYHIQLACFHHLTWTKSLEEFQRSFHSVLSLNPLYRVYSLRIDFYCFRSVQGPVLAAIITNPSSQRFQTVLAHCSGCRQPSYFCKQRKMFVSIFTINYLII